LISPIELKTIAPLHLIEGGGRAQSPHDQVFTSGDGTIVLMLAASDVEGAGNRQKC
jgi:hypothetical protein